MFQTWKGWFFAAVTASLLFFLVRHGFRQALATEARLWESEELLRRVIAETTDAVSVKDLDGNYLLFNAATEAIFGKKGADVMGKDGQALFPPQEAAEITAADQRTREGGQHLRGDVDGPWGAPNFSYDQGAHAQQEGGGGGAFRHRPPPEKGF